MNTEKIKQISSLLWQASVLLNEIAEECEHDAPATEPKETVVDRSGKTPEGLYTTSRIAAEFGLSVFYVNDKLLSKGKIYRSGNRLRPDCTIYQKGLACIKNNAMYWTKEGGDWLREFIRTECEDAFSESLTGKEG